MLKYLEVVAQVTPVSRNLNAGTGAGMVREVQLSQEMWMIMVQGLMIPIWKRLFVHWLPSFARKRIRRLDRVLKSSITATFVVSLDILRTAVLTIPVIQTTNYLQKLYR